MTKLVPEDFYKLRFAHDPQTCGKRTAFVLSRPDKKDDDYKSAIWIYDGRLKQFTHGPKDSRPRWSPDGKRLAFVSKRGKEKKSQIIAIPSDGGEGQQICEFGGEIGGISWSSDGRSIFFLGTVVHEPEEKRDDVKRITTYPFYFNGKGFLHNKETHLYRTSMSGKVSQVTKGNFTVNSFSLVPGKDLVVLSIRKEEWDVYISDLYSCTLDGKRLKGLTEGPATYNSPSVSPDGKTITFAYRASDKHLFNHNKISFLPVGGGKPRVIEGHDLGIGNGLNSDSRVATEASLRWSDDGKKVYFLSTDGGNCNIYECDVAAGKVTMAAGGAGSIESFDIAGDGFSLVLQTASKPVELFTFASGAFKRVSNFNRALASMGLQEPEHLVFNSFDRQKTEGWFIDCGKKNAPSVLEIHGGPKTAYGNAFEFEFHLLASNGFNVMFCNPRGSDGYSEEFASQVKEHFGDGDYRDLLLFVDKCLERNGSWDGKKLGVTGGSYGGFMTNWIIGHTDRFRAAVTQRSICNQVSFFGTSDIGPYFNSDQIGGSFWANMDTYWLRSPLRYAESVKTPLLIIHSEEDYRCPVEQAYQLYTALRFYGKEVEMELFPGENHDLSRAGKPMHRVRRLSSILGWFQKHL